MMKGGPPTAIKITMGSPPSPQGSLLLRAVLVISLSSSLSRPCSAFCPIAVRPSGRGLVRGTPSRAPALFKSTSRVAARETHSCLLAAAGSPEPGPFALVEERDACGVGFVANPKGELNHKVIELSLRALGCMEHRGACSADKVSGDGAGIMTAIPWDLIEKDFGEEVTSISRLNRAVGMVFLPRDEAKAARSQAVIEEEFSRQGMKFHGWRQVPVDEAPLGPQSLQNLPRIVQFVVSSDISEDSLDRAVYLLRRMAARRLADEKLDWTEDMYFCSVSARTIVYKGMTNANALGEFYLDLKSPDFLSNFAVYHRRFSTNTMPKWPLAQPMRMLGHNGEINTLVGNVNWARAREGGLKSECEFDLNTDLKEFIDTCDIQDDEKFEELVDYGKSDSANLDSVFELLVEGGKSPLEALMVMVPEAYESQPALADKQEVSDFYRYWEGMQEPWDGPALLVWSDGKKVGACLDRNGLRPARYLVTKGGLVCMMSETGVVPIDESEIVEKGRLGPGQMIAYDLKEGKFSHNWDIKQSIAKERPYGEWLAKHHSELQPLPFPEETELTRQELLTNQIAFGWSSEDVDMQIADMASSGKETTFSMGDDIPLAVLSEQPHVLFDYFKQRFAQVTNPPIDPLREAIVMSVGMLLGSRGNPMDPTEEDAALLKIDSPVLNAAELKAISAASGMKTEVLSTLYPIADGPEGLAKAVEKLTAAAVSAVEQGAHILVLSDKAGGAQPDKAGLAGEDTYIPPLLAVGAVHHKLIEQRLRMKVSLISETGQAWSTHHFACLVGYGASAVHPYLALEAIKSWWESKRTQVKMTKGTLPNVSLLQAQQNFRSSVDAGLLKIMSKMGISLLSSYQGAQIFESIGIGQDLLQLGFKGTPSRLGGLSTAELANEVATFHAAAYGENGDSELEHKKLNNYGYVQFYRSGEYHHNSPLLMKSLHAALEAKEFNMYKLFMESLKSRPTTTLRDMLDFNSDRPEIPLESVESVDKIMARFCTGGMSLGALSREAHETLAIGVNRIGGKSNSGEGGEDPLRFNPFSDVDESTGRSESFPHLKGVRNGDLATSAIKQVASGRFGVTPEYLMSAKQIEIKMAQGAKPGEGGQLPGPKINEYIAGLRSSTPGVTLISPPPHHDIYSIEDLAQLIFDLHQVNPAAGVSVKLVAEVGIGTIAAGVAKANADVIQISGHDGGTGASPLSSIKHAGSPWELGLAEVHRTLVDNKLRDRSLLRVDGGIKTGWDVMMAALMGAEEYGFGTIAMIAEGCIMARVCHTNTCPVGVTTQKEELRKKFPGTPDNIVTFFQFVAEEVRMLLAHLGYESLDELIGRSDLLKTREGLRLSKTADLLDLDFITKLPDVKDAAARGWLDHGEVNSNGPVLDDDILKDEGIAAALENAGEASLTLPILNTDRSVCGRLSGAMAKRWGNKGFAAKGGKLSLRFNGSAGQSFGSFLMPGMDVVLNGEANDYVGKSIHGGTISVMPAPGATFEPSENVIIGNTCLYGATGGKVFVNGRAGERFAVRNSAAHAVVEGCGDHSCEYMTGGVVVVLGTAGRNIGAGMTGGLAYFLDDDETSVDETGAVGASFASHVNHEIVKMQRVVTPQGEAQLKGLIEEHVAKTGSAKGEAILADWAKYLPKFYQLVPPSEQHGPLAKKEEASEGGEEESLAASGSKSAPAAARSA